jgi:hypothetical protein
MNSAPQLGDKAKREQRLITETQAKPHQLGGVHAVCIQTYSASSLIATSIMVVVVYLKLYKHAIYMQVGLTNIRRSI